MLILALLACDPTTSDTPPEDSSRPDSGDSEPCSTSVFYADADGDGFGDGGTPTEACEAPDGHVAQAGDCDDTDAEVHPDALEVCNHVDDDCDGAQDYDGWIPGDYDNLASAVAHAGDGDHLCLEPGEHEGYGMTLSRSVHLHGSGPETVLNANGSWMFRDTSGGYDFTLEDATVTGLAAADGKGGLVHASDGAQVLLRRLSIDGLDADVDWMLGGLVYGQGSDIVVDTVRIQDLDARSSDGAYGFLVYASNGSLSISGLQLVGGSLTGDVVGSVYSGNPSSLEVRGLEIAELALAPESLVYSLGAYYAGEASPLVFEDVTVRDNSARYSGAVHSQAIGALGLYVDHYGESPAVIRRLEATGNTLQSSAELTVRGGVVHSGYGDLEASNVLVAGNHIQTVGGGKLQGGVIEGDDGTKAWTNSDVSLNTFQGFDFVQGAVFIDGGDALFQVTNTSVVGNDLSDNGAWYCYEGSELSWEHSNVYGNLPAEAVPFFHGFHTLAQDTLSEDPLYQSEDDLDLTLRPESPLIDAGDPGLQDTDGSTSDIGAFGGPEAW